MDKLRVAWIPQLSGQPFCVEVASVAEGTRLLTILADYDQFQLDHQIKPDDTNLGWLEIFDATSGEWWDYTHECTDEDHPLFDDDHPTAN